MTSPNHDGIAPALPSAWRFALPDSPIVVCLCGSTRFFRTFQEFNLRETLAGRIVLSIGGASKSDADHFAHLRDIELEHLKRDLDTLHMRKIDLCDEVLILDVGGYMGESTTNELRYAQFLRKHVRFLSQEDPDWADPGC